MKHIILKLTLIEARAIHGEINADLRPIWGKIGMDGRVKATLRRIRGKLDVQLKDAPPPKTAVHERKTLMDELRMHHAATKTMMDDWLLGMDVERYNPTIGIEYTGPPLTY